MCLLSCFFVDVSLHPIIATLSSGSAVQHKLLSYLLLYTALQYTIIRIAIYIYIDTHHFVSSCIFGLPPRLSYLSGAQLKSAAAAAIARWINKYII